MILKLMDFVTTSSLIMIKLLKLLTKLVMIRELVLRKIEIIVLVRL